MSTILYRPPAVNASVDPALQNITIREQATALSNINGAGDSHASVVFEQINNVVTNVTQANPADTVLDLVDLNLTDITYLDENVTATIITGEPIGVDRTVQLAPANTMTGRRIIVINRSSYIHLIVKDYLLNTIVVIEGQTSEEILSDGYNWIAVN